MCIRVFNADNYFIHLRIICVLVLSISVGLLRFASLITLQFLYVYSLVFKLFLT